MKMLLIIFFLLVSCDQWREGKIETLKDKNIKTTGTHPANDMKVLHRELTYKNFQSNSVKHDRFKIIIPWGGITREVCREDCMSLKLQSGRKLVILDSFGLDECIKEAVITSREMKKEKGDISKFEAFQSVLDSTVSDLQKENTVSGITATTCMIILKQGILEEDMLPAKLLKTKILNVVQFGNIRKSTRILLEVYNQEDRNLTIVITNEKLNIKQEEIDFIIRNIEFK